MNKEDTRELRLFARLACFTCLVMVCVLGYVHQAWLTEVAALRLTIRNLEAETANRAATSELQSRVIAAYTAELMRLGYSEDRLDAIQRSK